MFVGAEDPFEIRRTFWVAVEGNGLRAAWQNLKWIEHSIEWILRALFMESQSGEISAQTKALPLAQVRNQVGDLVTCIRASTIDARQGAAFLLGTEIGLTACKLLHCSKKSGPQLWRLTRRFGNMC